MPSRSISRDIVVDAPPAAVFAVLTDPRAHPDFDGSGMLRSAISGPDRLTEGSRFGMAMSIGVPYRIQNTVVEFEQDRRIAWRHLGRHRWRYELEPAGAGTRVTESFDLSTSPAARLLELLGWRDRGARAIERTLPRLKALVESRA